MNELASNFRKWCGDEQFGEFAQALGSTCRQKNRLMFWQEQLIATYREERGVAFPTQVLELLALFPEVLEEPITAAPVMFLETEFVRADALRSNMLEWAVRRKSKGLQRDLSLTVCAEPASHPAAVKAAKSLFLDEAEINRAFMGATVSVRIQPIGKPTPITGLTIHVDDRHERKNGESLCLQWTIGESERKRPWWKFW